MKKQKDNRVSRAQLEAVLRRAEAKSLQPGDELIIKAVMEKTLALSQLVREDKIPSRRKLRRLMAISWPSDDNR